MQFILIPITKYEPEQKCNVTLPFNLRAHVKSHPFQLGQYIAYVRERVILLGLLHLRKTTIRF
jgi:hypothetical protein